MTLNEAIRILIDARVHCGARDVRTPDLREALRWLFEHYPETKSHLVDFWHAVEFRDHEYNPAKIRQSAQAVPSLHRIQALTGWSAL